MSVDALLWICTLLFAAAMLILSAMRHADAAEAAAETLKSDDGDSRDAYPSAANGVNLGGGWTLGGSGLRLSPAAGGKPVRLTYHIAAENGGHHRPAAPAQ